VSSTGEVWFYHLERRGVEDALPELLEKTLKRGWRAIVRATDAERLNRLDQHLWTFRADAVLPHGLEDEPHAEHQPILLTTRAGNPNGAAALFLLGDADRDGFEGFERCVVLFEDADLKGLEAARGFWRKVSTAGTLASYWRETDRGFEKKA
jgi:DNA polymerase-3 subunit chi